MDNKIETEHEIVGKTLSQIRGLDLGTLYPVVDSNDRVIVGVYSAEFGTPAGYELNEKLQAFVPTTLELLTDNQRVAYAVSGHNPYQLNPTDGARDEYYYSLTTKSERIEYLLAICEQTDGELFDVKLTTADAENIENYLSEPKTCEGDFFHDFNAL